MRNNLDKYFKKKLNSPQQPPKDAWDFIQSQLPKEKEKKRILPFWMRLSGIAATLLLMLGLGYWLGTYNNNVVLDTPEFVTNPGINSTDSNQNSKVVNEKMIEQNIPNHLNSESNYNTDYNNSSNQLINSENQTHSHNINLNNSVKFTNSESINNELNFNSLNNQQQFTETLYAEALSDNNSTQNSINLNPTFNGNLPNIKDAKLSKENKEITLVLNEPKKNEEKEKKKKKITDFDRFHISAFASPLAFNTFVGNSMLADEMSQYHTENNVTLAYGVKAAYSLNPKLKIRTGVSMIGLEQITNDVPLAVETTTGQSDLAAVDKIKNINYIGNVRIDNNATAVSSLGSELIQQRSGYGNMQQQTSYIEIPLEAELSLFETNSIGISATGGGSTWVLSKNKIYVHTDDYTQELGQANNLNNVTFSANAGLKFDLNLTDNVKLNVEPNFRYLVNPVNNIEKYNPYTIGVNAGISVSLK